ncbi:NAD-binding protein [Phellopilus nigrolimitatus]|nr:NAD-binding protein [Phellopilus nigrolimitatus]
MYNILSRQASTRVTSIYLPISINLSARRTISTTPISHVSHRAQFASPLGSIGVQAALRAASNSLFKPCATLLEKEFSLEGRVAIVSGGRRGIGLEMAEALAEAGAAVYCFDFPSAPDETWKATKSYISRLGLAKDARLEYASVDVTNQKAVKDVVDKIAEKEGRLDVCVAAAGVLRGAECLDYPEVEFEKLMQINMNGVLYTAQAAARQMEKLGSPGSIVLIASMSGSITNRDQHWIAYNTNKSAVLQMGRSMACELGPKKIRVNTLSPGYIYTDLTANFLSDRPLLFDNLTSQNPLGRLGRPDELRGVIAWLASDASTFCTGSDIIVSGGHNSW